MNYKKGILERLLSSFISFLLIFQLFTPTLTFAQEASPTPQPSSSVEPSASPEPSIVPSSSPEVSPSPTPTSTLTETPSSSPSLTPFPTPTPSPSTEGNLEAEVLDNTSATSAKQVIQQEGLSAEEIQNSDPSLITDKADYAPTDAAVITGTNFQKNTLYSIHITSVNGYSFSTSVTTNDQGSFTYIYQLDGIYRPIYNVEILGPPNNQVVATTTFTDSNPSADLDQCANLGTVCDSAHPTQWQNGNLGQSQAIYHEGDSVPYRMVFDSLSLSSHTVTIQWDTTKSGKHALDYLTSFNRTVGTADPCAGISGCSSSSTFVIPADPNVTGAGVTSIAGNFTLYGGTITGVSAYTLSGPYSGDSSTSITITFTASQANPVLAWGGHIADRADWGPNDAAINIPGSPYHMRLLDLDGKGGNQDRSLSAEAVIFPASITIIKDAIPNNAQDFGFTTTGGLPPATFLLDDDSDPTLSNTQLYSGVLVTSNNGNNYTITEGAVSGWTLSFNNPVCSVTSANGGSQSGNAGTGILSINLKEGENVTCTFINTLQQAHLTLVKTVTNDNGGSAAATDWTLAASGPTPISGSTGNPSVTNAAVNAGTYNLSESGGPSGYTPSSWSCVKNGGGAVSGSSVVLGGGDNATCTINNNDIAPSLTLNKVIVNDNGGTAVESDWILTATGPTSISGPGASGSDDVVSPSNFSAGTYTLSESAGPSGYSASNWVCTGGLQSGNQIILGIGESASCTITNDDIPSTLIITKDAQPNDLKDFTFTRSFGVNFLLDDDLGVSGIGENGDIDQPQSMTFNNLNAGSYTVSEVVPSFWDLQSINCIDKNSGLPFSVTTSGTGMTANLGLNKTVECTFVNKKNSPTRTQGFWQTHTIYTSTIFATSFPASMLIGSAPHKGIITNIQSSGQSQLFGAYYSNIANKTTNPKKRSDVDRARMQLLQQLVTARLNCAAFGCGLSIQTLILNANIAYAAGNISQMLSLTGQLDTYNNSGDTLIITPVPGKATPKTSQDYANLPFWDNP